MLEILIAALVFYLVQLLVPSVLGLIRGETSLAYLASARDETPTRSPVLQRARRAAVNMQESLFIFLPLMLLAISRDVNVAEIATVWLGLRVAYMVLYMMGISHIRTIIWTLSIICLFQLGAALI